MESTIETFIKLAEKYGIHRVEKSGDVSIYIVFKSGHVGYLYVDEGELCFDVNKLSEEGYREEFEEPTDVKITLTIDQLYSLLEGCYLEVEGVISEIFQQVEKAWNMEAGEFVEYVKRKAKEIGNDC